MTRQQQRRRRLRRNNDHRVPVSDDNLQQIRDDTEHRIRRNDNNSQQTVGASSSSNNCQAPTISIVTTAQRKELIEKNLYCKRITREESVRELAILLAASRVGTAATTTLPIGGIHNHDENNVSNAINNENDTNQLDEEQQQEKTVERMMKSNNNFDSNNDSSPLQHEQEEIIPLPLPSQSTTSTLTQNQVLPPSFDYDFSMLEAQEQQHDASVTSSQQSRQIDGVSNLSSSITITPGTSNNKWNVIIKNVRTGGTTTTSTTSNTTHQQQKQCKLECSICLDTFTSGEEIAWAKDSGSSSIEVGCDHIFHRECLISWLLYHNECPLCRRLLVHADADVRFAGW